MRMRNCKERRVGLVSVYTVLCTRTRVLSRCRNDSQYNSSRKARVKCKCHVMYTHAHVIVKVFFEIVRGPSTLQVEDEIEERFADFTCGCSGMDVFLSAGLCPPDK